jgi:Icc-related predicted phosphoesterase
MKARGKIYMVWDQIPEDTDILITHGPPKGILDLTYRRDNAVDVCGDSSLLKRVMKLDLKLMCFGHIHNCKDLTNAGIKKIFGKETIFSNGSCVTDGKWGQLSSHGNEVYLPLR